MRLGDLVSGPDPLIFAASDDDGPIEVIVPALWWENALLSADWGDADDRREYARARLENRIAKLPIKQRGGVRVVRVR